jgi:quercetin dioxygenase-like cupin family protein
MNDSERLRQHPEERLASPVEFIDLGARAGQLRAESHPPVSGHRQIAVFRQGPVTLVVFAIEPGGQLKEHRAEGVVTIHALAGRIEVIASGTAHQLLPGQLLALAPGVPHSVSAEVSSEMLLTVCKTGV